VEHVSRVGRGRCWQTEGAPSDETGAPSAACTAKGSTVKFKPYLETKRKSSFQHNGLKKCLGLSFL